MVVNEHWGKYQFSTLCEQEKMVRGLNNDWGRARFSFSLKAEVYYQSLAEPTSKDHCEHKREYNALSLLEEG